MLIRTMFVAVVIAGLLVSSFAALRLIGENLYEGLEADLEGAMRSVEGQVLCEALDGQWNPEAATCS